MATEEKNQEKKDSKISDAEKQKRLQAKYMEFQVLEQQIKQLQLDIQNLDAQLVELKSMQQSISELKTVKKGSEIFVPVANGMFVSANINSTENILVNVGSSIVVDKTIPESLELIEKQANEIAGLRQELLEQMNKLGSRIQAIESDLQNLVSKEE